MPHIKSMLCPDTSTLKDNLYKLKNDYHNIYDKISISYEIALCFNEETGCKINETA